MENIDQLKRIGLRVKIQEKENEDFQDVEKYGSVVSCTYKGIAIQWTGDEKPTLYTKKDKISHIKYVRG